MPPLPPALPSTLLVLHIPPPPPHANIPTGSSSTSSNYPFSTDPYKSIISHYTPPIEFIFQTIKTETLVIALWAPFLHPNGPGNENGRFRSHHCDRVQGILTGIYSLIEVILGEMRGVKSEGGVLAEGVNFRVVFYYDDEDGDGEVLGSAEGWKWQIGPVFSVKGILGEEGGRWKEVVYVVDGGEVEGEGGKRKRPNWLSAVTERTDGAERLVEYTPPPPPQQQQGEDNTGGKKNEVAVGGTTAPHGKRHEFVAVGGTFDHLHSGHKLLLTTTAFLIDPPSTPDSPPPKIFIGVTGPKLLEDKKHYEILRSWTSRAQDTLHFITSILTFSPSAEITTSSNLISKLNLSSSEIDLSTSNLYHNSLLTLPNGGQIIVEVVDINDPYGPTITEETISALVVSEETKNGGLMVNEKRRELGWNELEVFVVGVVMGGGGQGNMFEKLSSTELRRRKVQLRTI